MNFPDYVKGEQKSPRYYGYKEHYKNGFATITRCDSCHCTALREDQHPVNPCSHCGGRVRDAGAGRWIKPTYEIFKETETPKETVKKGGISSFFNWFKETPKEPKKIKKLVSGGYWELAKHE